MANKNFEDYGFKPSAVIEALNKYYKHSDYTYAFFRIERPDSKEGDRKNIVFYKGDKAVDDAIKYLRSMDIFYQPGLKWDDVKYKLSAKACNAEFGYSCVTDAWPKVNPCFVGPRTKRENELRDYILNHADMNRIRLPIDKGTPEDLIYYLISLLVRNRNNAEAQRERADGYLEKIDRLQKELDSWDCWYNDKEHYVK